VSAVIGSRPYEFLTRDYALPCVISGFEPLDILQSVLMLSDRSKIELPGWRFNTVAESMKRATEKRKK